MNSVFSKRFLLVPVALAALIQGCDPVPRRTLTLEEKQADLMWLYSQFSENYAPLEYKEKLHSFNYDNLKKAYLAEAEKTKTNDEFYTLMYRFIAEFKDGHTSGGLSNSGLPGRAQVAYLGFGGVRTGNYLTVTEILPTIDTAKTNYPIKVGDKITKLDGRLLVDIIKEDMVKLRNVGNDEANITFHMNRIFIRLSTTNVLPSSQDAKITVMNDLDPTNVREKEIVLPWVVKDLVEFKKEQSAKQAQVADVYSVDNGKGGSLFSLGFLGFNGELVSPSQVFETIKRGTANFSFLNGFKFVDNVASWTSRINAQEQDPLLAERMIPFKAIRIKEANTYPAYITREKVKNADGTETKQSKLVGYIYLDTFSPQGDQATVVQEFKATLTAFQELGVKDVVIDMINNGGGSLTLGMELAQALSPQKVVMPDIEFRLSDSWLDQFESDSLGAASDTDREISRRIFASMLEDRAANKRLSRRFNTEMFSPYAFNPNEELAERFNIVLMTNEMCASMCDIFSAILKDNAMAKIVGAKTMGAGGNVVSHSQAPNSHMDVNQTESLIVRSTGDYIENNGIDPDFAMPVNESVMMKYEPVRLKAIDVLTTEAAAK